MLKVAVTKEDKMKMDAIYKRAKAFTDSGLKVGVFASKGNHSGRSKVPLSLLAKFQEGGTKKDGKQVIPPRPFIQPTLAKSRNEYLQVVRKNLTNVLEGRLSQQRMFEFVGKRAVKSIQDYIVAGNFTPLSPITAKRKGTTVPLIETGQLYDAIDYKVK